MARDLSDKITWVLVADGQKAILLRNHDADSSPDLRVVAFDKIQNPPTHMQGVSRPGRVSESQQGVTRKSSFEEADFHLLAKEKFARDLAERINSAADLGEFDRLVVFAPPKTLGELRAHFSPEANRRIVAAINRDLTRHPTEDIEAQVATALRPVRPS